MQRGPLTRPRDRCRQSGAEPDPVRETPQRMQPGVSHDLCPTAFNIDLQHTVTVHLASALLIGSSNVQQRQEKQIRRAFPRIRDSTHIRPVNDQG